jgi:ABC-type proline/glycine betaine transport system permease subunit
VEYCYVLEVYVAICFFKEKSIFKRKITAYIFTLNIFFVITLIFAWEKTFLTLLLT